MNRFVTLCIGFIFLFSGLLLGLNTVGVHIPLLASDTPRPTPEWKEKALPLTQDELSTMSAYFPVELESALASYAAYMALPTPTPLRYILPNPTFTPYTSYSAGPTGATGNMGPGEGSPSPILPTNTGMPTVTPTVLPTPTPWPISSPTPVPSGDITAPVITINGGPVEGSVVTDPAVCFPIWVVDNLSWWSAVQIRYRIDTNPWSAWAYEYEPCISGLSKGSHIFSVAGKDEAGNISKEAKRTFIVQ